MTIKKKIGDLLVEAGLIDEAQLGSALLYQQKWGGKLGGCLVQMGFVTERDIAQVLAKKLNHEYADLFHPGIPEDVFKLVKPDIARKYHCMPVRLDNKTLVVALADPHNMEVADMLRFATGLKIKTVFALESEIEDAIAKYYDGKPINKDRNAAPIRQAAAGAPGEAVPALDFELGDLIDDDDSGSSGPAS